MNLIALDAVYVYAPVEHDAVVLLSQVPVVKALIEGCKRVNVVQDINDIPAGCADAAAEMHNIGLYVLSKDFEETFAVVTPARACGGDEFGERECEERAEAGFWEAVEA